MESFHEDSLWSGVASVLGLVCRLAKLGPDRIAVAVFNYVVDSLEKWGNLAFPFLLKKSDLVTMGSIPARVTVVGRWCY